MIMIKQLQIKGFKSFRDQTLDFSNLTILTGLNSSGKSSVLQAMRMLYAGQYQNTPFLRAHGGYYELKSKLTSIGDPIEFRVGFDSKESLSLIIGENTNSLEGGFNDCFNLEYIGADRLGPEVNLPIFSESFSKVTVGEKGQYSADYYLNFDNVLINEKIRNANSSGHTLSHQLKGWMDEISPNTSFNFKKLEKHDISHIEIDGFRATNTGYGISHALPIVLAALVLTSKTTEVEIENPVAKKWFENNSKVPPLLLVENPEGHLHPRGQTKIGKLLALAACCGAQVVLETHSDHVLDGIRIQVNQGVISPKDLSIYFFEKNLEGETIKTDIIINESGKIQKWPKGFFDQSLINLRDLST